MMNKNFYMIVILILLLTNVLLGEQKDITSVDKCFVNSNVLNLRKRPSLRSKILKKLSYGSYVNVLYKIPNREIINKKNGVWVYVKTISGEKGYLFDAYIKRFPPVRKRLLGFKTNKFNIKEITRLLNDNKGALYKPSVDNVINSDNLAVEYFIVKIDNITYKIIILYHINQKEGWFQKRFEIVDVLIFHNEIGRIFSEFVCIKNGQKFWKPLIIFPKGKIERDMALFESGKEYKIKKETPLAIWDIDPKTKKFVNVSTKGVKCAFSDPCGGGCP